MSNIQTELSTCQTYRLNCQHVETFLLCKHTDTNFNVPTDKLNCQLVNKQTELSTSQHTRLYCQRVNIESKLLTCQHLNLAVNM